MNFVIYSTKCLLFNKIYEQKVQDTPTYLFTSKFICFSNYFLYNIFIYLKLR